MLRDPRVAASQAFTAGVLVGVIVVDHEVQRDPWVGLGDLFEIAADRAEVVVALEEQLEVTWLRSRAALVTGPPINLS